jgi:hypothetical protein
MYFRHLFLSIRSITKVLSMPAYAMVAILSGLTVLGVLVWLFSFDTLLYVLTLSNYPASEKVNYFLSPYANSFGYFFRDPVVASRLIFSVLAGINIALYIYIRKHEEATAIRKGLGGFAVALIGSGCIACGTSLLSPLLVGVGAGAGAIMGAAVSTFGFLVGIMLMLYSINGFGKQVSYELARIK